jgi:23S rRNA pseudouridine2457 synthase
LSRNNLILFNKPYGVVSQFTGAHPNLSDYVDVPGYYAAGRLDKDSEGLLILTSDGSLQARISHPRHKMPKTYWVQVEGNIDDQALEQLSSGIELKDGMTKPATATRIDCPLPERDPPVRFRENIPTSWLSLTISEGRNRQVRRMSARVGFPALRLFRFSVGPWSVDGIAAGEHRQIRVNLPKV